LPLYPKAVANDADAGERHCTCRYHRIEQPKRGKRYRRNVVEECPEQILSDRPEGHTRQPQRLDDFHRTAFDKDDVPCLDGNVGAGTDCGIASYAAISSAFEKSSGGADFGFAVDSWRPNAFWSGTDAYGHPVSNIFQGINFNAAIIGKIAFIVQR
jgi:hypothetical protein